MIRRFLRDSSAIRVSRSMRDVAYKVLKTRENYLREHQKEPSIEEIAKQLELRREEIVFALDAISDPISLYEPIYSDGSDAICVMDQVRDDKNCDEQWLNHLALREAMGQLGEREQLIKAAVLPRKNPNGGIQGGGHFSGSGISFGEECLEADSEGAIK